MDPDERWGEGDIEERKGKKKNAQKEKKERKRKGIAGKKQTRAEEGTAVYDISGMA